MNQLSYRDVLYLLVKFFYIKQLFKVSKYSKTISYSQYTPNYQSKLFCTRLYNVRSQDSYPAKRDLPGFVSLTSLFACFQSHLPILHHILRRFAKLDSIFKSHQKQDMKNSGLLHINFTSLRHLLVGTAQFPA